MTPAAPTTPATTSLPNHARVVIIGGGIIGCSLACHVTRAGWSDVVLREQGQLSCGATWHAAGLVPRLRAPVDPSGIRIKS